MEPSTKIHIRPKEQRGARTVAGDSIWGNRLPPWYTLLRWHEPYIYHLNIKNPRRMLERLYSESYMKNHRRLKNIRGICKIP